MKKLLYSLLVTCWILFTAISSFGQTPQGISYQAIARNTSGNVLINQAISVKFIIRNLTSAGTIVYRETHSATTNSIGLFNLTIGAGTPTFGTFSSINWSNGAKFLQVDLDPTGGSSYTTMGTSQMMSVPYALYAENANVPGVPGTGYGATSASSVTLGTGAKSFVTQNGLAYLPNMRVRVATSPTQYMEGIVTSYVGNTLALNIDRFVGFGSFNSWTIGLAGDVGATGVTGAMGATGATGATGPQGPIGLTGPAGSSNISGTTNQLMKFTGTNSGGNSIVYDNGTQVGIGTTTPSASLQVKGSGTTSTTSNFLVQNSSNDTLLRLRDDGKMGIGYNGSSFGRTINVGGTGINFYTADEASFGGAIFPTDTSLVMWSNSASNNYLVFQPFWGNTGVGTYTPNAKLHLNGAMLIGGNSANKATNYELSVDGEVIAESFVTLNSTSWPDYVFEKDYPLMPLNELETSIKENKHLPGIPSAREMETNGINLGEMTTTLTQKIEELTLYMLEMNKKNEELTRKVKELEKQIGQKTNK